MFEIIVWWSRVWECLRRPRHAHLWFTRPHCATRDCVVQMVPSHMLPMGAFDMSDFSSDSDSVGSDEAPAQPQPGATAASGARHRFRRDAASVGAGAAPPAPAKGRVTAAAWLQGLHDSASIGSTRGGMLGGGTLMGRSGSRANLVGSLERGSGSLLDDCMSTDSGRARRKRTFASAMQSDRPPRPGLSRVPGTSIIKATPAATKVPRSSEAPVTAVQLFVSACAHDPCSLVAVTACVSARPSVRPADGHVPESGSSAAAAAAAAAAARVAAALGGEAGVQCVRNVFAVDALAAPFKPGLTGGPWPGAATAERQHAPRVRASTDAAMAPPDDGRSGLDVIAAVATESPDPTQPCAVRPPAPAPSPLCLISSSFGFVMTASATGSVLAYRPSMVARPQALSSRVRSADKAAQHVHHYRLLQEYPHTPPSVAIGTVVQTHDDSSTQPHAQPRSFKLPSVALAAAAGQLVALSQAAELAQLHTLHLGSVVHDLHACGGGGDVIIVSSAMHAMTIRLPEARPQPAEMDPSTQHGGMLLEEPGTERVAQFSEIAGGSCAAAASVPDVGLRSANGQLFLYSDRLDVYVPGRHPAGEIPMTSAGGFAGQCGTVWRRDGGETIVASAAACGGIAASVVVGERGTALAVWSIAIEEGPSADTGEGGWGTPKGGARSARLPLASGTALAQQEVLMFCQGGDQHERSVWPCCLSPPCY